MAHVGTANGLSLSYIFNSCQRNGNTIYAIDHFYWQSLEEHLRLWQDQKTVVTMTMSSEEACEHFENGSVDLVFLDSDHTASEVTADILRWIPKLRKFRGVLCGHDYCPEAPGVYQTVRRRFGKQVSVTETFWWVRIDRNAVKRATSRLL